MDEDDILGQLAEGLDDEVLQQLREELAINSPPLVEYEYLVLANIDARIYVSKTGSMTRAQIAAQLRRLADYVESLTEEQAHRP